MLFLLAGCTGEKSSQKENQKTPQADDEQKNKEVFSQCQNTTPRFSGQAVSIDTWTYSNSSAVQMSLQATNERVNVTGIKLLYDDGWQNKTGINTEISAGDTAAFTLPGLGRSSGTCASTDVLIEYNLPDSFLTGLQASGSGSLRGPVP